MFVNMLLKMQICLQGSIDWHSFLVPRWSQLQRDTSLCSREWPPQDSPHQWLTEAEIYFLNIGQLWYGIYVPEFSMGLSKITVLILSLLNPAFNPFLQQMLISNKYPARQTDTKNLIGGRKLKTVFW